MSQFLQPDQDDRYQANQAKKNEEKPTAKLSEFKLSKPKLVILVICLLLILLFLCLALFKSDNDEQIVTDEALNSANNSNMVSNQVQELVPPDISRTATQTAKNETKNQERVEIPGQVADVLADKIKEIDRLNSSIVALNSENKQTDHENELPLSQNLANQHFTIQITSSSSLEGVMNFVKKNQITNYQIYESRRENQPWYTLIKGEYQTADEAKKAIQNLPSELQKNRPWIKSGAAVNKEKLNNVK